MSGTSAYKKKAIGLALFSLNSAKGTNKPMLGVLTFSLFFPREQPTEDQSQW
jgi:hypothetical protein